MLENRCLYTPLPHSRVTLHSQWNLKISDTNSHYFPAQTKRIDFGALYVYIMGATGPNRQF